MTLGGSSFVSGLIEGERQKGLRRNAIHESSHFLALISRGYLCDKISITETGGLVSGIAHPRERTLPQQITDEAIILLAGHAGEEIEAGRYLAMGGSESDYRIIVEKLTAVGYEADKITDEIRDYKRIVQNILITNWPRVERIATALQQVRELTYTQAINL
jgi:hypothetical protein